MGLGALGVHTAWWRPPTLVIDGLFALAAAALTVAVRGHAGLAASPGAFTALGIAGSTVPLVMWRRQPLLTVLCCTAGAYVLVVGGARPDLVPGPVVALFLLGVAGGMWIGRPAVRAAAVIGALAAVLAATTASGTTGSGPTGIFHTGVVWGLAFFAGEWSRLRSGQVAALRDRLAAAARDIEHQRALAVAEERARIARDLHDSAGHAISLIAVRAGAARLRHPAEPDRTLEALVQIEAVARRTAEEVDHIVGALRTHDPAARTRSPAGLDALDTLVAHLHRPGCRSPAR